MENKINTLHEIAAALGLEQIAADLESIRQRATQPNSTLMLPLVGEFSSGKTTLINALTDSKALETATKPTTATIYEIHFGAERSHALSVSADGTTQEITDLGALKNETLADTPLVALYDTSTRVPATTVLVDTPGLSSSDPKHREALVNFLPQADAILMVVDINQQITRTLVDFIETMKLSKRPIFLVLTKSDTKAAEEVEQAKQYISQNCRIPLGQVVVVSAYRDRLDELYALMARIQETKNEIIRQVDLQRLQNLAGTLREYVASLIQSTTTDEALDDAIQESQYALKKMRRNINSLVEELRSDIEEQGRMTSRRFENIISDRLNELVMSRQPGRDQEAVNRIESTARLLMNDYVQVIRALLNQKVRERKGSDEAVYVDSLETVDLSNIQISNLGYGLSLDTIGHQFDKFIKTGVLVVGTIAAAGAVVRGAAAAAKGAGALTTAVDMADTATDVASIASNRKLQKTVKEAQPGRLQYLENTLQTAQAKYKQMKGWNEQAGQEVGAKQGFLDSIIGNITEAAFAKPQRIRAIRNYIDHTLSPEFRSRMQQVTRELLQNLQEALEEGAAELITQREAALQQLKQQQQEQQESYQATMARYKAYLTTLSTF